MENLANISEPQIFHFEIIDPQIGYSIFGVRKFSLKSTKTFSKHNT